MFSLTLAYDLGRQADQSNVFQLNLVGVMLEHGRDRCYRNSKNTMVQRGRSSKYKVYYFVSFNWMK